MLARRSINQTICILIKNRFVRRQRLGGRLITRTSVLRKIYGLDSLSIIGRGISDELRFSFWIEFHVEVFISELIYHPQKSICCNNQKPKCSHETFTKIKKRQMTSEKGELVVEGSARWPVIKAASVASLSFPCRNKDDMPGFEVDLCN